MGLILVKEFSWRKLTGKALCIIFLCFSFNEEYVCCSLKLVMADVIKRGDAGFLGDILRYEVDINCLLIIVESVVTVILYNYTDKVPCSIFYLFTPFLVSDCLSIWRNILWYWLCETKTISKNSSKKFCLLWQQWGVHFQWSVWTASSIKFSQICPRHSET